MHLNYILKEPWSIVEEGFDPTRIRASESIFSLGNGAMGQRANFEEHYTGSSFQGSYIAGVYYPDKTRVGWWKNGYPEYFAKVLNAPNWIGIDVIVNGEKLDLFTCKRVENFRRELNMKEGWLERNFKATLQNGVQIKVSIRRFLSLTVDEVGAIAYDITPINNEAEISFIPYLDAGIKNEDSNWDDEFWEISQIKEEKDKAFIKAHTRKTKFHTCTFMESQCFLNQEKLEINHLKSSTDLRISYQYQHKIKKRETFSLHKFGGYVVGRNHHRNDLVAAAINVLAKVSVLGYGGLLDQQILAWKEIWDTADIVIEGDVAAQQGIRFNIFQLNQTYLGKDPGLNIGPKGFTGEKYGGSTYWDTEAYCLPFYLATKGPDVAKNLLTYRYLHLDKAIENAEKLGFSDGAALYPMVTMNGEECHNEWEITFEEIHRNGAITYAIFNYHRYTGDYSYIPQKGLEVLIGIARFWLQRATYSTSKNKYVILGVTGPNEYENNVNNNWYTNYLAHWCLRYTKEQIEKVNAEYPIDFGRIQAKTKLMDQELIEWQKVSDQMYFPYDDDLQIYLQQEGFLDKELIRVSKLDPSQRPINQKWSWDRILRSPYIKQADILQGMYLFEDQFTPEQLAKHFDFYEPFTVHESSLSPCVHAILAASMDRMDLAYEFYLQTSRLDLDDYNKEVEEGLHITSMAGTWMSVVEGFGGMRVRNDTLSFNPKIPKQWNSYKFKVNFRNHIVTVNITHKNLEIGMEGNDNLDLEIAGELIELTPGHRVKLNR